MRSEDDCVIATNEGLERVSEDCGMAVLFALNLFDLARNDDYREYSRRSRAAVEAHGGRVVALGRLAAAPVSDGVDPRQAMILVEWGALRPSGNHRGFRPRGCVHPLRENGTRNYLWWTYDRLEDLRPLLGARGRAGDEEGA